MTKAIFDKIDELSESLKNNEYKKIIIKEIQKKKKIKRDLNEYRIISYLLKIYFPDSNISDVTIWRLLKIKEKSLKDYNLIKNGSAKIKPTFNKLFEVEQNVQAQAQKYDEPDFDKILNDLTHVNDSILVWYKHLSNEPNEKTIKKIDAKLFDLRKSFNKIYNFYNLEEDNNI